MRKWLLVGLAVPSLSFGAPPPAPAKDAPKDASPAWLGEAMPLPLPVKTPEDLTFKAQAERQYLLFNLLASGKVAWDRGDYATAQAKWETLLRTPNLPADLEAVVKPLAKAAKEQAAASASGAPVAPPALPALPSGPADTAGVTMSTEPAPAEPEKKALVAVSGTVTGGGSYGPGGAVVMLRRADGPTPKPRATRVRAVIQKDKRFIPRVLAVPLNATVEFRNDDDIFHNVFSLSKPNEFDLGLYKSGASKDQLFKTPGPVQLLCNIHSNMSGMLYVSDTPYFAQADAQGRFTVKNVPPGNYTVEVWHEWSTKTATKQVKVAQGMEEPSLAVDGDKKPPAFVPDKSGKPRQPQLGY